MLDAQDLPSVKLLNKILWIQWFQLFVYLSSRLFYETNQLKKIIDFKNGKLDFKLTILDYNQNLFLINNNL